MALNDYPSPKTWLELIQWGKDHYRDRTFPKDSIIPSRPGLVYIVHQGVVRLSSRPKLISSEEKQDNNGNETLLSFYRFYQPFEVPTCNFYDLTVTSHLDNTNVVWLYWNEIHQWPEMEQAILQKFCYHQQRQLRWISLLNQKSTCDRLLNFLILLIQDGGECHGHHHYLPYPLTHNHIGNAIRATRVTITRLMVKLREQGVIVQNDDNLIALDAQKLRQVYSLHLEPRTA